MNDKPEQHSVSAVVRDTLDARAEALDAQTLTQLRERRQQAMAAAEHVSWWQAVLNGHFNTWQYGAGALAASLLAVWVVHSSLLPQAASSVAPAVAVTTEKTATQAVAVIERAVIEQPVIEQAASEQKANVSAAGLIEAVATRVKGDDEAGLASALASGEVELELLQEDPEFLDWLPTDEELMDAQQG